MGSEWRSQSFRVGHQFMNKVTFNFIYI